MNRNIVLTGMRGSGKTTIGKKLARTLNKDFIDLDKKIVQLAKMEIKEIVEKHGWDYFRELERKVTKEVSKLQNTVIATGGGTIIDPENEKALRKNGFIVFLKHDIKSLAARIKNGKDRPSLTGKHFIEELEEVYAKRKKRYKESADLIFQQTDLEKLISLLPQNCT